MGLDEQIAQMTNSMEFVRLCNVLLTAEYEHNFQIVDGTRGDDGNDGYIASQELVIAIYCPTKPERRTDQDYIVKIKSDLGKVSALREAGAYSIKRWAFVTPRTLSNKVLSIMRDEAKKAGLDATHFESTFLAGLLHKHKHLLPEFPGLYVPKIDEALQDIVSAVKNRSAKEDPPAGLSLIHHNIYKPGTGDNPELHRLRELRDASRTPDIISELKSMYYKSKDPIAQLNALIGLLSFYNPLDDPAKEMVDVCDMGIQIARRIEDKAVESYFLSWKGYFLSFMYSELDMRTATRIRADSLMGIQTVSVEERTDIEKRLAFLYKEFNQSFADALDMAKESKDPYIVSAVLISYGNAAGQRAMYLGRLGIGERALADKTACRVSIMAARDIHVSIDDELGAASALHNLANNIRFLGEEKEAQMLIKDIIEIAKKHKDKWLLQKALWMEESLRTGKIPDYLRGERRT
jgi:hypothetical protein